MAGIKDKVAVIGMGCTKFGERWDCGLEDLLTEAITECCQDAAIDFQDIDAFWFGPFTVTFCDRNICPGCCEYRIVVEGKDFEGEFEYLRVVKPVLTAIIQGYISSDY
jgi:acetyl-CoA acetyltransferase